MSHAEEARRLGEVDREIQREHREYKGALVSFYGHAAYLSMHRRMTWHVVGWAESAQTGSGERTEPRGYP